MTGRMSACEYKLYNIRERSAISDVDICTYSVPFILLLSTGWLNGGIFNVFEGSSSAFNLESWEGGGRGLGVETQE